MAKRNQTESAYEVAEFASLLAVAFGSGMSITSGLEVVFTGARGAVALGFQKLLTSLELGGNLYDELQELRSKTGSGPVADLVLKLQVSLEFGSPIVAQLESLAKSLRSSMAAQQLVVATKKENLMLLPLVFLILPVTVVFAVFPSMQYLNLNF